jgi:drug/metabolite transporter (DMT)-like permease
MTKNNVTNSLTHEWKNWMVFAILAFVWGGSFILIKKGLLHFTPLQVGALRIAISAIAFIPIFLFSKVRFPKDKIGIVSLVVLLGNGIPAVLFAVAETRIGSAVTGILNSLTPIFALIIGVWFFGTRFKRHYLTGFILGCIGIAIIMIGERDWHISSYVLFVVLGTLCYGMSANLVKHHCQDVHPIALTAVGFFPVGVVSVLILWWTGAGDKLTSAEAWKVSMPSLLVLSLVCTVFANILFYWLIQRTSAIFGSAIAYAIPCMALVWGLVDGEHVNLYQFAGFGFIIAAVYNLRRQ